VPYGTTCTFVPGWKGLQDLVNRSGRATTWTGAVYEGDEFDYRLGDSPFVSHRPGDEDDQRKMTHVYAVGRVNGSNWPIVEVWTLSKVWKHRDKYNKVGQKHYSFRDPEMYARKVVLLQVLKYVPSSIELSNAVAVANASELGQRTDIIDNCVTVSDIDLQDAPGGSTSTADFIDRIENAADKASADAFLESAMAYGLPEQDLVTVTKAHATKWPAKA
jgi:recombination protein RecT